MEAARIALEFAKAIADATPALFELWQKLAGRDAFLAAIDSMLAIEFERAEDAIRRKHRERTERQAEPTQPVPLHPTLKRPLRIDLGDDEGGG